MSGKGRITCKEVIMATAIGTFLGLIVGFAIVLIIEIETRRK